MKKKLLPISLLCLVTMILAGCGGKTSSSNSQAPSSSGEPSSVAPSSSSEAPVPSSSSVAPSSSSSVAPSSSSSSAPSSSSSSAPSSSSSSSSSSSVAPQPVAVTGVALDKAAADVILGQTLQLTATVSPQNADNKEVTWSSSDPDVASVKNGLVKAESVGQAEITVKTRDGGKTAKCVITVIKEITSVSITNKSAFEGFIVDDMESINVEVDPADNVTALLAAGALKATSSDPTVATVVGLTVTALKAGKSTIEVELFGKKDSFELTVGDAIPGVPYTIANALAKGIEEAPFNGSSGKNAAITTTCFELQGLILAISPNGETGYNAILDDGTGSVYLQISKESGEDIPLAVGDYAKVTCKLTNYYGLLEGVSRKAATGVSGSWVQAKDVEKLPTPETPIVPTLNEPEAMTGEQYNAYFDICKTNGTKNAAGATFTNMKYVTIDAEYLKEYVDADKGGYKISDKYGLAPYGYDMDKPFEGQKSTLKCFLIGANTGKGKSNAIVMDQIPLAVESVAINEEPQTIVHGNSLQLTYTTSPAGSYSNDVAWATDDADVATVDAEGLVTGLYVGEGTKTANIKVRLGSGDSAKESATVAITVFGETVVATNVELAATANVYIGEEIKLAPVTTPAMVSDIPQWTSSDETVATVNNKGVVKGLKEGTANITVRYNDNVAATCAVTVSPEPGISIDNPLDVAAAVALGSELAHNTETEKVYYVKGYISRIDYNYSETSTTATFWLAKGTDVVKGFEGYKVPLADGVNVADFKIGAEAIIRGKIKKYSSTIENGGDGVVVSLSYADRPATALTLPETAEVNVDSTTRLTASVLPVYSTSQVVWSSSDETVATVENGVVSGLKEGKVTITAKVSDEIQDSCEVTVKEPATEAVYNLKSLNSKNTAYATMYDVEMDDGQKWAIPGNQSLSYGTKLGGKLSAATDISFYSKSAYEKVSSIVISHGTKDSAITVNSLKLYVLNSAADAAATDYADKAVETVVGTYVDAQPTVFKPAAADGNWNGKYFRVVYNLSSSAASSNKGVVLTELRINFVETVAKPQGTFFASVEVTDTGKAALGAAGNIVPVFITFGADDAVSVSVNGVSAGACVLKSFNKLNGELVITTTAFGDLSMTYNPANSSLDKLSVLANKGILKYDAGQSLRGNEKLKYWNCDGTTEELQTEWNRRYGDPWTLDNNNADRVTQNTEFFKSGSAMRLRPYADNRFALATKDFAQTFNARNISFWVYNSGSADATIQCFAYKSTGYSNFIQPFSNKTIPAGQWTYVSAGFTATDLYGFQIFVSKTASALIFDDICLY